MCTSPDLVASLGLFTDIHENYVSSIKVKLILSNILSFQDSEDNVIQT